MNAAATKPNISESTSITTSVTATTSGKIRILKIATCPSISGKSTLTYHIGYGVLVATVGNANSEILFRVHANSSSGYFSREWISLVAIQQVFAKVPADGAITSYLLHKLFKGKSANTPAFMLAALLAEGLVQPSSIKDRCHDCTDGKAFFTEIQALIESDIALDADAKPKKSSGKIASGKSVSNKSVSVQGAS